MTTQPTPANWLSIAALGLIWGATFMVVAIALEGYGPLTVACARTTMGAVALLALMVLLKRPLPEFTPQMRGYLIAIGLLNTALPFALLSWGAAICAIRLCRHFNGSASTLCIATRPCFYRRKNEPTQ